MIRYAHMRYRELVIGVVAAALLLLVFVFRTSVFRAPAPIPQAAPQETATQAPDGSTASTTAPQGAQAAPVYHGRKLDEVRLDAEATKSLSEQQKIQIAENIRTYAKTVHETPDYVAAWLQLAILKKGIGDYEGSRDIWEYVTLLRPHEITAFLNLGDVYTYYLKDYAKADQSLRAAMKVDRQNEMAYIRLSELYIYFYKEKEAQAEAVLKDGIAANPNNANLQKALARLYERAQAK